MAESLNPKTREQIRALCRQISVSHDLDPEIQRELYGHMEDKLHAYLGGEEPVTEEDAFILVREHFGDPAVLKSLFRDVHPFQVHASLARRLGAALALSAGLTLVLSILATLMAAVFIDLRPWMVLVRMTFAIVGSAVLPWIILRRWQRWLEAGRRLWFLTWHPLLMVGLVTLLFVLNRYLHAFAADMVNETNVSPVLGRAVFVLLVVSLLAKVLAKVSECLAWLWWCDRPPRQARAVGSAALVYVSYRLFVPLVRLLDALPDIFHSEVAGKVLTFRLTEMTFGISVLLVRGVAFGLVAYILYAAVRHVRCRAVEMRHRL